MLYWEFDEVRVEWNGSRTFNVQIELANGKWTDVHCAENHSMNIKDMNEVFQQMLDVYANYVEEDKQ